MDYRQLGDSELKVSAICLGTMTFGQQNIEAEAHAQLDYALSRGVNFIDAAEMYPVPPRAETVHRTEAFIGTWLRKQARDRVIVATKVAGPSRGLQWIRGGPVLNRQHITAAIDGSLQRLQTDYIDLYQLHWPERNVPMFGSYAFDPRNERAATFHRAKVTRCFCGWVESPNPSILLHCHVDEDATRNGNQNISRKYIAIVFSNT